MNVATIFDTVLFVHVVTVCSTSQDHIKKQRLALCGIKKTKVPEVQQIRRGKEKFKVEYD